MSAFEVRARLKIRDGKLDEFKRQAAEMMRQTREKDTGTLATTGISADRKSTRLNSSHIQKSRMPSSA